jgi:hypothetical protein
MYVADLHSSPAICIREFGETNIAPEHSHFTPDGMYYYEMLRGESIKKYQLSSRFDLGTAIELSNTWSLPENFNGKVFRISSDGQKAWTAQGNEIVEYSYWNPLG